MYQDLAAILNGMNRVIFPIFIKITFAMNSARKG